VESEAVVIFPEDGAELMGVVLADDVLGDFLRCGVLFNADATLQEGSSDDVSSIIAATIKGPLQLRSRDPHTSTLQCHHCPS